MPATIPAPPFPAAIQTVLYGLAPQRYLPWCRRRYGDVFEVEIAGLGRSVVLADPQAIRDVFALDGSSTSTNPVVLEPFLGSRSLLCTDGEDHRQQRRLLARAFRPEALQRYAASMERATADEIATWPDGRAFPLHPALQRITLDVILDAVFGVDERDRRDALGGSLRSFLHGAGSLAVLNPPFRRELRGLTPWARFQRDRRQVLAVLDDEIARRRAAPDLDDRSDILSALVAAQLDGDGISHEDLQHNLLTMVLAGHDTTATALAWTFDLLLHHPAAMARLRTSLEQGDAAYLEAVVKESLRLRPVVVDTGRTLTRDAVVGGRTFPAGTSLMTSILLAHNRADRYEEPAEFRPERFLEGAPEPLAWVPFGGGIRRCLGAGFATLEMHTIARAILERCDLEAGRRRQDTPWRRAVTMRPLHGVPVVVRMHRWRARSPTR